MAEPVMAVVRVRAPADVDPHVLEAELTRAIASHPMSAEVMLLPEWRRRTKAGLRRHGFVAVLCAATATSGSELINLAETVLRKRLRRKFGAATSAKVRPVRCADELHAYWCSVRGTPHRP